jgi:hypothetical protein
MQVQTLEPARRALRCVDAYHCTRMQMCLLIYLCPLLLQRHPRHWRGLRRAASTSVARRVSHAQRPTARAGARRPQNEDMFEAGPEPDSMQSNAVQCAVSLDDARKEG